MVFFLNGSMSRWISHLFIYKKESVVQHNEYLCKNCIMPSYQLCAQLDILQFGVLKKCCDLGYHAQQMKADFK